MQAYGRRHPVRDVVEGSITLRQLRVMVEHLPARSPVHRTLHGPWTDVEALLWDISTQLRDLVTLFYNANRQKDAPPAELPHLPLPEPTDFQREQAQREDPEQEAAYDELVAVLNRPRPEPSTGGG